jgi:hypothetical protein
VIEMALDYSSRSNGGGSWLGLVTIDPLAGTIERTTYAPAMDQWETDANSDFSYAWDWEARFSGKSVETATKESTMVDDFSVDTSADYTLSDSYGSGGNFRIIGGELVLKPGANNTVAVMRSDAEMELGQRWGVTSLQADNVMFMASTAPVQPDQAGGYGFRLRRDDNGFSVETYAPTITQGKTTPDPGGAVTLWIERISETRFGFSYTDECGGRTEIDEVDLAALADFPQLYVGMQAFSVSNGADIHFDDLVFQTK